MEERTAGPTVVHLDQALSPAPSWAALGWLETSIRSYAKYVDVAAKALQHLARNPWVDAVVLHQKNEIER